jgi:hypothetical protein
VLEEVNFVRIITMHEIAHIYIGIRWPALQYFRDPDEIDGNWLDTTTAMIDGVRFLVEA